MIIRTILEAIAIILLIYGFIHEEKIAKWEQKIWRKFKKWINS